MPFGGLRSYILLLYIVSFIFSNVVNCLDNKTGIKLLNVGEELLKETLPLQRGSCVYQLEGLKPNMWYEVKISYPASIPCSFSLHLRRGDPSVGHTHMRKLLNTEKIIFGTDDLEFGNKDKFYVLVTVEAAGVVALPRVRERKDVIFNIVCDELLIGIPRYTWWVVILVVVCLGLALVVPVFLPSYMLKEDQSSNSASRIFSKDS